MVVRVLLKQAEEILQARLFGSKARHFGTAPRRLPYSNSLPVASIRLTGYCSPAATDPG